MKRKIIRVIESEIDKRKKLFSDNRSYLVMKSEVVEMVKEVKRSEQACLFTATSSMLLFPHSPMKLLYCLIRILTFLKLKWNFAAPLNQYQCQCHSFWESNRKSWQKYIKHFEYYYHLFLCLSLLCWNISLIECFKKRI